MGGRNKERNKMCFWNIAGVWNKSNDVWTYLENYDVVGLVETWLEQKSEEKLKSKLLGKFNWWCVPALRESKMGRAKGGIMMAAKKGLEVVAFKKWSNQMAELRLKHKRKNWRIVTVYSQYTKETMQTITEGIEEREEGCLILGGDFNARVGEEGGPFKEMMTEEIEGREERRSKDKKINRERRLLIEGLRDRSWFIINGCLGREGEWTCIGERGASVIDLVIANTESFEEIADVKEGERTESDHFPLEVMVGEEHADGEDENGRKVKSRTIRKMDWSKEGIESYHNRCRGWNAEGEDVEGIWGALK